MEFWSHCTSFGCLWDLQFHVLARLHDIIWHCVLFKDLNLIIQQYIATGHYWFVVKVSKARLVETNQPSAWYLTRDLSMMKLLHVYYMQSSCIECAVRVHTYVWQEIFDPPCSNYHSRGCWFMCMVVGKPMSRFWFSLWISALLSSKFICITFKPAPGIKTLPASKPSS